MPAHESQVYNPQSDLEMETDQTEVPNLLALGFHAMPGWDRILAGYSPQIRDGFIEVPDGPGLGVELDHDETRKYVMKGETYFD